MVKFKIIDRKPVIIKETSRYISFPYMVKINENKLLMLYREASANPNIICHGKDDGDTKYMFFENGKWGAPKLLYKHDGEYEQMGNDATILKDKTIIVHSREYKAGGLNKNYVAKYYDDKRIFTNRKQLEYEEIIEGRMALFGKVIELGNNELLLGVYGGDKTGKGEWTTSTGQKMSGSSCACLISRDNGDTWQFYSWIARCAGELNFFEPVMVKTGDKKLYCLLRTRTDFYFTASDDNGKTWGEAKQTFHGHAATGIKLSTGEILMLYRGVIGNAKIYKGKLFVYRISDDNGKNWSEEIEIDGNTAVQPGSFGMGDAVEFKDGSLKVVYYTSDADQSPWIEECTLRRV